MYGNIYLFLCIARFSLTFSPSRGLETKFLRSQILRCRNLEKIVYYSLGLLASLNVDRVLTLFYLLRLMMVSEGEVPAALFFGFCFERGAACLSLSEIQKPYLVLT